MPDQPKDDRDFHTRNADLYAEVKVLRRTLIALLHGIGGETPVAVMRASLDVAEKEWRLDVTEKPDFVLLRIEKIQ